MVDERMEKKTLSENYMELQFCSDSSNEAFARVAVAAFIARLDPTMSEVSDIKTAVSEAVTNAIIHGYEGEKGFVHIAVSYQDKCVKIRVWDEGRGIENIEEARQPLYTSKPELERSGMGFTVMEMFMDTVEVKSTANVGTSVVMTKLLQQSR